MGSLVCMWWQTKSCNGAEPLSSCKFPVSVHQPVILSTPLQTAVFKIPRLTTKLCWHNTDSERRLYKGIKPQWWGKLKSLRRRTLIGCTPFAVGWTRGCQEKSIYFYLQKSPVIKASAAPFLVSSELSSPHWTLALQVLTNRKCLSLSTANI